MTAVFFDLDGTLVDLPDDFAGLFEATLGEHGIAPDDDQREHGVDPDPEHHNHREYHERYTESFFDYLGDCDPEPYREAMADLRERFDLAPTADALAETYTEREARATDLRPGVEETLDALTETDDHATPALGVLTNGGARSQHRKLAHHGFADYFDAVVVSGEIGARKPDPEIFVAARDAIPANEYVFVADDLERDVLPAQEAGFTGVYLAGEDAPPDADDRADHVVESLGDVPDLLG